MLLGNDIVDLKDSDSYHPTENFKFLDRVFCDEEKEYIFSSNDPKRTLWTSWAIKESAYKAWKRVFTYFVFSPKLMKIDYLSKRITQDGYKNLEFEIVNDRDWVATYCLDSSLKSKKLFHWVEEKNDKLNGEKSSIRVRKLVVENLSKIWNEPMEEIEVTIFPPPEVRKKNSERVNPVSLSHHGRFVSAFLIL